MGADNVQHISIHRCSDLALTGLSSGVMLICFCCLQEFRPKTKIGASAQIDATDLPNAKPKFGFAFDLKN